jgi:hypothetical protein
MFSDGLGVLRISLINSKKLISGNCVILLLLELKLLQSLLLLFWFEHTDCTCSGCAVYDFDLEVVRIKFILILFSS